MRWKDVKVVPAQRGAVPGRSIRDGLRNGSSPRTRGCSVCDECWGDARMVVPAHAGLFRTDWRNSP